jgi:hypothetical protein
MWTAAHMFIFGLLPYLYENRKNKLIFCFLSIFMHFSFLIPLIVLVVFLFFKPSLRIVFALFILSVFVNEINIEAIKSLTSPFLPDFASDRFDLYTSDSHLEKNKEISSSGNFFVNLVSTSFKIAYYLLVLILFYSYFKSESYFKEYECPISFTFTLGIVCNIIFSIPSMGRFMTIHYFLFFGILLILLSKSLIFRGANKFLLICMPFLLMFTIQSLRSGFDTISFITVFGNPIINVFTDEMYPIINFIK